MHDGMTDVRVRPMTQAEFDEWQTTVAADYAAEQVAAGRWPADGAVERALAENRLLLPDGLATPRMLILGGIAPDGRPIGRIWVGLDHPRGVPDTAFLYDIEVLPSERGHGFGRALLTAAEGVAREAGLGRLELNVFAQNGVAIALYSSAGYTVTTQQMRKAL